MVDYVLVKKEMIKRVRDMKATLGKGCFSLLRHLVMGLAWENQPIIKKKEQGKIKLWKLKTDK